MPGADGEVLIVGAGLIGTSIGLAARAAGRTVWLSDVDPDRARMASSLGAGTPLAPAASATVVDPALVVVAVPPAALAATCIEALRTYPQAVVSHVGSVQSKAAAQVETSGAEVERFVGSHPIAGRELSGPAAADPDLFVDRPWAICRVPGSSDRAVEVLRGLVLACRARPVELAPAEHDRLLARLSHTPQLVASALAAGIVGLAPGSAALAGTGLRDTTRLADSDPQMWAQIATANAAEVADGLRAVAEPLLALAASLERQVEPDVEREVIELMQRGRAGRALLPGKHGRPPVALASVHCVIPDSPGALARLFALVAAAGVNIEDVRVEHAPGQPFGTAELAVSPADQAGLLAALTAAGWTAGAGAGENL